MEQYYEKRINKDNAIWVAVFGLGLVFFLYQIIGSFFAIVIFGLESISNPGINFKLYTIASHLLFILLPALLLLKFYYSNPGYVLKIRKVKLNEIILYTIGFFIVYLTSQFFASFQIKALNMLSEKSIFLKNFKDSIEQLNKNLENVYIQLLTAENAIDYTITFILICILPAIGEEILFRGFAQNSFMERLRPFPAIALTSFFFSFFHFNIYGIVPLFLISLLLGFVAYFSNNIVGAFYIHFLNNFLSLILFYAMGSKESLTSGEDLNLPIYILTFLLFFSLALFSLYIYYLKEFYRKKTLPL